MRSKFNSPNAEQLGIVDLKSVDFTEIMNRRMKAILKGTIPKIDLITLQQR